MPREFSQIAGDAYTSDYLWKQYRALTDVGNRLAGTDGEHRGAETVLHGLEAAGLKEANITTFDIPTWERGEASLTVEKPLSRTFDGSHELLGLPGSPPGTVEAELVDVGPGLPESFESTNVEGKVVLVSSQNPAEYGRPINRIEKYCLAEEHGAAAFLYYNDVPGSITPTGAVGFTRDGTGTIPAAGTTREVSRRILRWLEDGPVTVALSVDATVERGKSVNVEAVTGPDTDTEIVVSGHVDAHDIADGARDNAAGTVLAMEAGRLLADIDLDTRVRVVAFGGEETGLYGSRHWIAHNDPSSIKALVNLDGIGFTRTLRVAGDETVGNAFDEVSDRLNLPIRTERGLSPFNDAWSFGRKGIPVVVGRSATDGTDQVVRYGHREWGHTHADTLDKIDPRDMRDLAIQIASGVFELASDEYRPEHRDPDDVFNSLDEGLLNYLNRSGRLDR